MYTGQPKRSLVQAVLPVSTYQLKDRKFCRGTTKSANWVVKAKAKSRAGFGRFFFGLSRVCRRLYLGPLAAGQDRDIEHDRTSVLRAKAAVGQDYVRMSANYAKRMLEAWSIVAGVTAVLASELIISGLVSFATMHKVQYDREK